MFVSYMQIQQHWFFTYIEHPQGLMCAGGSRTKPLHILRDSCIEKTLDCLACSKYSIN
jgi:hypothetical protein